MAKKDYEKIYDYYKTFLKYLSIFVVLLIVLRFFLWIFVTIESGFVWVKYRLWKISYDELKSWLHVLIPFIESVKIVNVRVKTIHYKWTSAWKNNFKEGIINKPAIIVLDARWLPINIELTVLYQLKQDEAAETIEKYWFSWDEKLVNPSVREVVRDILGNYEAEIIPEKRQEIANKIKSSLQKKFKNSIVNLVDVQLRNIELPSRIKEKILQVQEAKQAAERQKYELEKAKVEAQTKVVKAKAEADSQIEYARWKAESVKIAAQAEAEKIKLKADAQAEANKKISQSLTNNLIKYEYIKSWDWKLPTIVWTNGNIFNLPSNLIK